MYAKWNFDFSKLSGSKHILKEAKAAGFTVGLNVSDLESLGLLNW